MVDTPKKLEDLNVDPRPILDDITVVIPTLGRPILEKCLYSIAEGSCWPVCIIVVDQGSNPDVVSWTNKLEFYGIRAVHLPSSQQGRASAVNRGLEHLETRFAAITDDDCLVHVDWLKNMRRHLSLNADSIVTGRVEPAGDHAVMAVVLRDHPAIYRCPGLKFDTMAGGNMGTSSDVIKIVGFFDEDPRLRCAEDGEWAYRALRSGVPIVYAPEVSVQHYSWRDSNQRISQYQTYARSHGAFYGKYLRKGDWFIGLRAVIHHLRAIRRWLLGFISGNAEMALIGRSYAIGLLPGIIAGLGKDKAH